MSVKQPQKIYPTNSLKCSGNTVWYLWIMVRILEFFFICQGFQLFTLIALRKVENKYVDMKTAGTVMRQCTTSAER